MSSGLLQSKTNTSNLVTLDTAQTILAKKTLRGSGKMLRAEDSGTARGIEVYHDGSYGRFEVEYNYPRFYGDNAGGSGIVAQFLYAGTPYVQVQYNQISNYSGTLLLADFGSGPYLQAAGDGILQVNGRAGSVGGQIELVQSTDVGTPNTNCARLGAEDVAGTAELIGSDEAGNETQLTPHAADGPPEVYDETPGIEHVVRSINRFTGRVAWLNMDRAAMCAETGERRQCRFVETLDTYAARTGKQKPLLDWAKAQDAKQAAEAAAREAELGHLQAAAEAHEAYLAKVDADHAAAVATWDALPPREKEAAARPVKPTVEPPTLGTYVVREPRDVRKLPPAWFPKDKQPPDEWMLEVGAAVAAEMDAVKAAEVRP